MGLHWPPAWRRSAFAGGESGLEALPLDSGSRTATAQWMPQTDCPGSTLPGSARRAQSGTPGSVLCEKVARVRALRIPGLRIVRTCRTPSARGGHGKHRSGGAPRDLCSAIALRSILHPSWIDVQLFDPKCAIQDCRTDLPDGSGDSQIRSPPVAGRARTSARRFRGRSPSRSSHRCRQPEEKAKSRGRRWRSVTAPWPAGSCPRRIW